MANKIGNLIIGLVILAFIFAGFTGLFLSMDESIGKRTSLTTDFTGLNNNLSGVVELEAEFVSSIDNSTVLALDDRDVDTRGTDALSLGNLLSKNVLVNWLKAVGSKLSVPGLVIAFAISLIGIAVTILVLRGFLGEGRV